MRGAAALNGPMTYAWLTLSWRLEFIHRGLEAGIWALSLGFEAGGGTKKKKKPPPKMDTSKQTFFCVS